MATTSADIAALAMDALAGTRLCWAFLHKEPEAARGELASDYDLAVRGVSAAGVLAQAIPAWRDAGLLVTTVSEYDAGSATAWLATPRAEHGVQVDFTWDASGANQLTYPIGEWVDRAEIGARWPTVPSELSAAYRSRKAALKAGEWRPRPSVGRTTAEVARLRRRIGCRAGFWVNVERMSVRKAADEMATRFARFLPTVRTIELDVEGRLSPARWAREVAPVVYRPALLVTHSSMRGEPRADLILDSLEGRDVDLMSKAVVAAMAARVDRLYSGRVD